MNTLDFIFGDKTNDAESLEPITRYVRGKLVSMSHKANAPHLASCLSCVDILVTAFWNALNIDPDNPEDSNRDRFILSKGHAAPTLYICLALKKFFDVSLLESYSEDGGLLSQHPSPGSVPGVEAATGSLGHGLPIGLGIAKAGKILGKQYRVMVVMSDGECNEGSVWEAAMLAPAQNLDNVIAIIDYNKWQATDRSNNVLALEPLAKKWEAFGWSTYEVDGHDLPQLHKALSNVPDGSGKPIAVIAHTIKGKGIDFMEDDNNWHYRIPTSEEVQLSLEKLGLL